MTVWFIGAGPGDPDLLTIRGRDVIARCSVCLYAGSLVPKDVVAYAPGDALVLDTAPMTLDEIIRHIDDAHAAGHDAARVHSGSGSMVQSANRSEDLKYWGSILKSYLGFLPTPPPLRFRKGADPTGRRANRDPTRTAESLGDAECRRPDTLGKSGVTFANLSVRNLKYVCDTLAPHYGADCLLRWCSELAGRMNT